MNYMQEIDNLLSQHNSALCNEFRIPHTCDAHAKSIKLIENKKRLFFMLYFNSNNGELLEANAGEEDGYATHKEAFNHLLKWVNRVVVEKRLYFTTLTP